MSDTALTTVPIDTDAGDHDRFSHWARKSDITSAHVNGTPVVALCGKVWVPSRDPKKYPKVSLATTGTHDTETLKEWWESAQSGERAPLEPGQMLAQERHLADDGDRRRG